MTPENARLHARPAPPTATALPPGDHRLGIGRERDVVLVVPESAVVQMGGHPSVFVRVGEGEFDIREIAIGTSAAGKVEVKGGIRDDEAVVVDGAFTLKSVALRGLLDEGE